MPKASCTGAKESCTGAKQGFGGANDSWETFGTLGPKDLLHPLLTTLGTFEVSGPEPLGHKSGPTFRNAFLFTHLALRN